LKPAAKARSIIEVDLRLDLKKVCFCSALRSSTAELLVLMAAKLQRSLP
jgi:hypothetical protein